MNNLTKTCFVILVILHHHAIAQVSVIQDSQGNSHSIKAMPDNKVWTTQNLNINIPESYCYNDSIQYCQKYGRLYTWNAAQKVCNYLGEGWRLPTNEEWQHMAKQFGGTRDDDPTNGGKPAFKALIYGGSSGFNVVLGGGRQQDGTYARGNDHGFYWTATETDSATAWLYNFGKNAGFMNRHKDGEKQRAFAVRCIKEK